MWGSTIQAKYFNGLENGTWLGTGKVIQGRGSSIWRSLLKSLPIINGSLCWKVGHGNMISMGTDRIARMDDGFRLSEDLIKALHDKGLSVLRHLWIQSGDHSNR